MCLKNFFSVFLSVQLYDMYSILNNYLGPESRCAYAYLHNTVLFQNIFLEAEKQIFKYAVQYTPHECSYYHVVIGWFFISGKGFGDAGWLGTQMHPAFITQD